MDLRPWVKRSFLGTSLLLLAGEAFVLALPSFPQTFYTGALVGVGEGARLLLMNMTWIAFAFAGCSVVEPKRLRADSFGRTVASAATAAASGAASLANCSAGF